MVVLRPRPCTATDKIPQTPDKFPEQIVDIPWISQLLLNFWPFSSCLQGIHSVFCFGSSLTNIELKWCNIFLYICLSFHTGIWDTIAKDFSAHFWTQIPAPKTAHLYFAVQDEEGWEEDEDEWQILDRAGGKPLLTITHHWSVIVEQRIRFGYLAELRKRFISTGCYFLWYPVWCQSWQRSSSVLAGAPKWLVLAGGCAPPSGNTQSQSRRWAARWDSVMRRIVMIT